MPARADSNNFSIQLKNGIKEINQNMDQQFKEHQKITTEYVSHALKDFEVKIDGLIGKIEQKLAEEISKVKSDVNHCYEFIKQIDKATTYKNIECEKSRDLIMKRLNRPDVIVSGLPKKVPNIINCILNIAEFYKVPLTKDGTIQCTSIKNDTEVLVKFLSIDTRDALMKNYYKRRDLKLKHVVRADVPNISEENAGVVDQGPNSSNGALHQDVADIDARVFLSDHLSPMASKLCFICRKLKRDKRISGFKFRNGDVPRVALKNNEGLEKTFDFFELIEKYQEFKN